MRLIIITLIICAAAVYVYIDYDHIHALITGETKKVAKTPRIENEVADNIAVEKKTQSPTTKFQKGDEVYIDSTVGDTLAWPQNEVPLWITYDGSDQEDKQKIRKYVPHRLKVRIIKVAIGRKNETWYYIRTAKGLPTAGWIREIYLSGDIPKRRKGKTSDWGL